MPTDQPAPTVPALLATLATLQQAAIHTAAQLAQLPVLTQRALITILLLFLPEQPAARARYVASLRHLSPLLAASFDYYFAEAPAPVSSPAPLRPTEAGTGRAQHLGPRLPIPLSLPIPRSHYIVRHAPRTAARAPPYPPSRRAHLNRPALAGRPSALA